MPEPPIVLSDAEVVELSRRMRFDYLSPLDYPALSRMLIRVDRRARQLADGAHGEHAHD